MRRAIWAGVLITGLLSIIPCYCSACTAFSIHRGDSLLVVGKNYDWEVDDGLVIVNKRNVAKTAFGQTNPVSWISRFGSVTFNQYGREMPNGGMNEAGLVVEILWLRDSEYPVADRRPAIGNLQWIQYQLDNCSTIDQVIASDTLVRIIPDYGVSVHYFICDSSGRSAVIEFLHGKMMSYSSDNLPATAITNNTYKESLDYLRGFSGFGGIKPLEKRNNTVDYYSREASLERFAHAAKCVKEYDQEQSGDIINYAFAALNETKSGTITQWSIVYDIPARTIYFRTARNHDRRIIHLKSFDFDCETGVKVLDINSDESGDVDSSFKEYSFEINLDLIRRSFRKTGFLNDIPPSFLSILAGYPDKLTCSK